MEISELLVRLLILLLPGILGIFIVQSLINKIIEKIWLYISTIIIAFLSYANLYILFNIKELFLNGINHAQYKKVSFFYALVNNNISIKYSEVFLACLCSIFISIAIVLFINKGWYYKLMNLVNMSHKTGNGCWNDLFENNTEGFHGTVYITDYKNNLLYGGHVKNYSPNSKWPELLLENVRVFSNDDRETELYRMDKLYLKLNDEFIRIEILNMED